MNAANGKKRRTPIRTFIVRFLRSPRLEIALGLFMFFIGFLEVVEDAFLVAFPSPDIHHAIILLGGITAFRGLIDVFEGLENVVEGETEIKTHVHKGHLAPQGDETPEGRT